MSSTDIIRRFRRADVRNVSYVELLFVIIFALLLVLTFSRQDVDKAQSALDRKGREMVAKEAEIARLRPLANELEARQQSVTEQERELAELRPMVTGAGPAGRSFDCVGGRSRALGQDPLVPRSAAFENGLSFFTKGGQAFTGVGRIGMLDGQPFLGAERIFFA